MRLSDVAVVVTSISAPNKALRALTEGCLKNDYRFIVVGDAASPANFKLEGCRFYSLAEQRQLDFRFAAVCPERHYSRKNLGYLISARDGVMQIKETDDDNLPYESFWNRRERKSRIASLSETGWTNVYRYFSDTNIWPRGFPLDKIQAEPPAFNSFRESTEVDCPIQQGLCDNDPDVDAIFRLTSSSSTSFMKDLQVALMTGSWCPFNSQNTTWWREAFPLLYLPAYCSFRMTDIWRSFVAQRIAWANNWGVLFHEATVWQERNQHNLLKDFEDELPGYLNNGKLCAALEKLELSSGVESLPDNLRICYETLVSLALIDVAELDLLEAWLSDLASIDPT